MFSCEYYEVFKNTYFEKHLQTVASFDQYFHVCLKSSGIVGSIEYFLLKKSIELLPLVMGSIYVMSVYFYFPFINSFPLSKKKTELRAFL